MSYCVMLLEVDARVLNLGSAKMTCKQLANIPNPLKTRNGDEIPTKKKYLVEWYEGCRNCPIPLISIAAPIVDNINEALKLSEDKYTVPDDDEITEILELYQAAIV